MFNYLKKGLFPLFILMMPYMNSASNAMGPEDYNKDHTSIRRVRAVQKEDQDSSVPAIQRPASLVDTSWKEDWKPAVHAVSHAVSSSVYEIAKGTWDLGVCLVRNPVPVIALGVMYLPSAVAASCACWCGSPSPFFVGCEASAASCKSTCYPRPSVCQDDPNRCR